MTLLKRLTPLLQWQIEKTYQVIPRKLPNQEQLQKAKLIAHRGEHDNHHILENTLNAFAKAQEKGVWGIEFDVRWTKDDIPVVIHDATCQRLFDQPLVIRETDFKTLQKAIPPIPSLEEVLHTYGNKLHLMIELKDEGKPYNQRQQLILEQLLKNLQPQRDFHLLCLNPELFHCLDFMPSGCLLPVAQWQVQEFCHLAQNNHYAGISGHFLLLNGKILQHMHKSNQAIGSGMVNTKNCFYRELHRGVDWVFSDCAGELQSLINKLITKG